MNKRLLQPRTFSKHRSIRAAAWFGRAATADRYERRIKESLDYSELVDELKRWHTGGKKDLRVEMTVELTESSTAAAAAADRPPLVDLTVVPDIPKRKTATDIHKLALPYQQAEDADSGCHGSEITGRWSCGLKDCTNYAHACWYPLAANTAVNHYPLEGPDIKLWSEAIRRHPGRVTKEAPPADIIIKLERRKNGGKANSRQQP